MAKEKEAKKKMNAANARGLNGMRQKVKKVTKEHETEVKRFQAVSQKLGKLCIVLTFPSRLIAYDVVPCSM